MPGNIISFDEDEVTGHLEDGSGARPSPGTQNSPLVEVYISQLVETHL